uniref:Uncharacterized protein n=1 Tax=Oryza sativa subsp. japonica TaxID=39947 RepID=Q9LX03_ORYSJ|nr:hypothetical protein [Oryza sativa Japonica Group]
MSHVNSGTARHGTATVAARPGTARGTARPVSPAARQAESATWAGGGRMGRRHVAH